MVTVSPQLYLLFESLWRSPFLRLSTPNTPNTHLSNPTISPMPNVPPKPTQPAPEKKPGRSSQPSKSSGKSRRGTAQKNDQEPLEAKPPAPAPSSNTVCELVRSALLIYRTHLFVVSPACNCKTGGATRRRQPAFESRGTQSWRGCLIFEAQTA